MGKDYIDFLQKRKEQLEENIFLYNKYIEILKEDNEENRSFIATVTKFLNIENELLDSVDNAINIAIYKNGDIDKIKQTIGIELETSEKDLERLEMMYEIKEKLSILLK